MANELQMLSKFGDEIWIADGPIVPAAAGFRYPTRMVVIRLPGSALFVWSPVALADELRNAVDALGTVQFLIAPNTLHHLHLSAWRAAYPEARLYGPHALRTKRSDLVFDDDLIDIPPPEWSEGIEQVLVGGNLITTEVVFFHRKSGTAVFTDLIQQFEPTWFNGWRAVVARLDLMVGPEPAVPRKFRAAFLDRKAARSALRRILAWPVDKVLMAHAPPIEYGGHAFLTRAFRWLNP